MNISGRHCISHGEKSKQRLFVLVFMIIAQPVVGAASCDNHESICEVGFEPVKLSEIWQTYNKGVADLAAIVTSLDSQGKFKSDRKSDDLIAELFQLRRLVDRFGYQNAKTRRYRFTECSLGTINLVSLSLINSLKKTPLSVYADKLDLSQDKDFQMIKYDLVDLSDEMRVCHREVVQQDQKNSR